MEYHKTPYITLRHIPEKSAIHTHWTQFPTSDEFRDGMNQIIEGFKKFKAHKVLALTDKLGAIAEENQKWTNEDWFPRAAKEGYNKIAIVLSSDIFNQLSVEEIMSSLGDFQTQYFDDEIKAFEWL